MNLPKQIYWSEVPALRWINETNSVPTRVVSAPSEPLGGVRNLQVLNPTMTTLNVRWEPAEGRVKEYKVIYVPAAGGAESMVGLVGRPSASCGLAPCGVRPDAK